MSKQKQMLPIPELTDVDVAFAANALDWMPPMEDIPDEFKSFPGGTVWNEIGRTWFYHGLPKEVEFFPKEGVDAKKAFRAVQATLGSFASKHEHKEACVAFMLSEWFDRIEGWEKPKEKK